MIQEVIEELQVKVAVEGAQKIIDDVTVNLFRQFLEGILPDIDSRKYGLRVDYRKLQDLLEQVNVYTYDDLDLNGWENDYTETFYYTTDAGVKKIDLYGTMADGSFMLSWSED